MTITPTKHELPISVVVHDDSDDVTIEWDETHPLSISLGLDEWTEDQWLDALESGFEDFAEAAEAESLNE